MSPRPRRRRPVRVLAAVWLCVIGATGCAGRVPPLPRLAPGDTVLAFGDSLTAGTGAEPHEAYPVVLSTNAVGYRRMAEALAALLRAAGAVA